MSQGNGPSFGGRLESRFHPSDLTTRVASWIAALSPSNRTLQNGASTELDAAAPEPAVITTSTPDVVAAEEDSPSDLDAYGAFLQLRAYWDAHAGDLDSSARQDLHLGILSTAIHVAHDSSMPRAFKEDAAGFLEANGVGVTIAE